MGSGLELQQFDIKFQHIQVKQNIVAEGIPRLRTLGLYRDYENKEELSTIDDVVENIIKEINSADAAPKKPSYTMGKLNLYILKEEQQFCKGKVRDLKKRPEPNVLLGQNSILRKVIKLKYTIEPAIVVPRKLISIIILEFQYAKGHQGISRTVIIIRHYFWWVGMWRDIHKHTSTCNLCI